MTTYRTRYEAGKHMIGNQAIVKVCSDEHDGQDYGYCLMEYIEYRTWRKQR